MQRKMLHKYRFYMRNKGVGIKDCKISHLWLPVDEPKLCIMLGIDNDTAWRIFARANKPRGIAPWKVTPEMVADDIDAYLLQQSE